MKDLTHGDAMAAIAIELYLRGSLTSVEAAKVLIDHDLDRLPRPARQKLLKRARRALVMLARIMPIMSERATGGYREITWTWIGDNER